MTDEKIYAYLFTMAIVSYLIRVVPLTLIRKRLTSRFLRSFLAYVPYVTLAVMTFPSMMNATRSPVSGLAALLFGILLAWNGASLFRVSAFCCVAAFLAELLLT